MRVKITTLQSTPTLCILPIWTGLPEESVRDYCKCAEVIWRLHTGAEGDEVEEEDLILLGLTPDCATPNPAHCFHTYLREKLFVLFQHNPVVLLVENRQEMRRLFANVEREDTAQVCICTLLI